VIIWIVLGGSKVVPYEQGPWLTKNNRKRKGKSNMKYVQKSKKWIFVTFLGIFALTVSILAVSPCFQWNDPICSAATSWPGVCVSCSRGTTLPVTDHGTHWVCTPVAKGWLTCPTDTACQFTASGNCTKCLFWQAWTLSGPLDQLVGGGNCPPPGS
jgi:hypothetical protein